MRFTRNATAVSIDLSSGGRLSSLVVDQNELLVGRSLAPLDWGWYPMAPWAGRTRRGRFEFGGVEYQLPLHSDGHAIHGTVFSRPWKADNDGGWSTDLGPDWPFRGSVTQRLQLVDDGLDLQMELRAHDAPFPAVLGWHPWFVRKLKNSEARLEIPAGFMLKRDSDGIASTREVPVGNGPWDDCFGGLSDVVSVEWPGVLRLAVESDCPYVVVFNEHEDGVCVEPQTGPPDALNKNAPVVEPGTPMVVNMSLRWS